MRHNAAVATVGFSATERRTVSEGRRRAVKRRRPVRRPLLAGLVLGALVCGVAWFFLVRAAIDFGRLARDGESVAWAFTVAATIGATACLLLMFILLTRVLIALGLVSEYRPRRAAGRRTR
jgi:hypothetical protein